LTINGNGLAPLGYWLCLVWAWLLIRLGLAMAAWAWLWPLDLAINAYGLVPLGYGGFGLAPLGYWLCLAWLGAAWLVAVLGLAPIRLGY